MFHPQTLAVLHIDNEDYRIDTFTSRLHGELLIGKYGSWIVELAASWAVIMVLTGLFLWWPRGVKVYDHHMSERCTVPADYLPGPVLNGTIGEVDVQESV